MTTRNPSIPPEPGLQVRGLCKQWPGQVVLRNVSFDVAQGQTLAILGASGCGKSTLLKGLAGLEAPDGGDIVLGGRSISLLPPAARQTVYLYQEPLLFPFLDVFENIAFGLRLRRLPEATIAARVAKLVTELELETLERRDPEHLSGGQRQRVAFGRALAVEPRLLLLDEPFSSLDALTRQTMQKLFRRLAAEHRITALFVTHDVQEALTVGDHHAILDTHGQLKLYRDRAQFCADPASGVATQRAFWEAIAPTPTIIQEPDPCSSTQR